MTNTCGGDPQQNIVVTIEFVQLYESWSQVRTQKGVLKVLKKFCSPKTIESKNIIRKYPFSSSGIVNMFDLFDLIVYTFQINQD